MSRAYVTDYEPTLVEMKEWLIKYPKATFYGSTAKGLNYLEKVSRSKTEYERLKDHYEKYREVYTRIRTRFSHKELKESTYKLCIECGIGGIFPYSEAVQKEAEKYNQNQALINSIIMKYGSMEQFLETYY